MTSIEADAKNKITPLNGLVLAGGKSVRMGSDKSALHWHGKEQRYYMADLLNLFCKAVYISCRPDQEHSINNNYPIIKDQYEGLGPFGAILSAFQHDNTSAWLVVACDLPLLDKATLSYLVQHRNPAVMATTFQSPHNHLPEPLITIWEPMSYPALLSYLAEGRSCPRKVLLNNTIHLLQPPYPEALLNANTKEDAEKATVILKQQQTAG